MAEEKKEKKPVNMAKVMTLAFMAVNAIVMGGGFYLVYASTLGYTVQSSTEVELNKELVEFRKSLMVKPMLYQLGEFNTNLEGLPRRFIRVEVNLEMLNEEGFEEVIVKSTETKDTVVRLLNGKKVRDLETVQGKLALKNQIVTQVNSFLDRGVVRNVYFSNFVVQ